jgi:hypothetical protein
MAEDMNRGPYVIPADQDPPPAQPSRGGRAASIVLGGVRYVPAPDAPGSLQTGDGPAEVNPPTNPNQAAQPAHSVLWSDHRPIQAGAYRAALFATIGVIITLAITILDTQAIVLPVWWPAIATPAIVAILRIWESAIDDRASTATD